MATLALAAAGAAVGGALAPAGITLLGATITGATIGSQIGALAGSVIDQALFGQQPTHRGPRLSELRVTASSEGAPIPRLYGRARLGGQVIWATNLEEEAVRSDAGGAGKGGIAGGGNQGDAVSVQSFPRTRLIAFRWPSPPVIPDGTSAPSRDPVPPADALFEQALTHVLEMEGGYDDDPYDPGGPTNMGITLAEFARDRRVEVSAHNLAELKADLQRIEPATARRIYRDRYWRPATCPGLPPALAFFHFDAAVNQGVTGAARMLQQSVGADIDGEIGPLTLAAVAAHPVRQTLARYADIRRQRYRALGHFWRFGKGWLRRVDRTLERARAIAAEPSNPETAAKEKPTMSSTTAPETSTPATDAKWWGQSMTIWGVILTSLSTVLPVIGPLIGLNLTADLVHQIGEQLVAVVQALGGLIGTALTVYGRARATASLVQRPVNFRL